MTGATSADRAFELFHRHPPVEYPNDWITEQLLALTAESGRLSLAFFPQPVEKSRCSSARIASILWQRKTRSPYVSSATSWPDSRRRQRRRTVRRSSPTATSFHFDRIGPAGPVRLEVEFENTTRAQMITIVKGC